MNEKNKRIIRVVKQHKLYATYRAMLNVYLNEHDRRGSIRLTPTPKRLFEAIKYENTTLLIELLKKWIQPRTEKQIENFKKFYLYKSKCNFINEYQ